MAANKDGAPPRAGASAKSSAKKGGTKSPSRNAEKSAARGRPKPNASAPRRDAASLVDRLGDFFDGAVQIAQLGGNSLKLGKAILTKSPESLKAMQEAGASLKDLREVAGLTRHELSEALEMRDDSLIEAIENGTATLSFELILRLASVLARHDPVPFIIRFTRTYRPELWQLLDDWGVGRVPLQFERERHFINIYRSQDAARRLTDEGFDKVLQFTRAAFESALHFASEQGALVPEGEAPEDKPAAASKSRTAALNKSKKGKP